MGCDIHPYIEYYDKEKDQAHFIGEVHISRDYLLFSLMAGVRSNPDEKPVSYPKGLPSKLSWQTERKFYLFVLEEDTDEDGCCSSEDAERWVGQGSSWYLDEAKRLVSNPDWHSETWLSIEELEEVQRRYMDSEIEDYDGMMKQIKQIRGSDLSETEKERKSNELYWSKLPLVKRGIHNGLQATIEAMRVFRTETCEPRLVIWFDN